jgi:hypothetical protein
VFLLASIGFWGIPSITERVLTSELNEYLGGKKIILSDLSFFDNLEQKDREKIVGKIKYLSDNYGVASVQPFFGEKITAQDIFDLRYDEKLMYGGAMEFKLYGNGYPNVKNKILHVEKFNSFAELDFEFPIPKYEYYKSELSYSFENNQLTIKNIPSNKTFVIPFQETARGLIEKNNANKHSDKKYYRNRKEKIDNNYEERKIFQGDGYAIYPTFFRGHYHKAKDSVSLSAFRGYLFYDE